MSNYDDMEKTIHVQDGQIVELNERVIGLSDALAEANAELSDCEKYSGRYRRSTENRLELLRKKDAELIRYKAVVEAARIVIKSLEVEWDLPSGSTRPGGDELVKALARLDSEQEGFKPNLPPCKKCSGLGEYPGFSNELSRCPSCDGTGYSEQEDGE